MTDMRTNLSTTLLVGDETIIVSVVTDPDTHILPVMLIWTADGINTTEEFYADVSTALARIAALVMCCEADWDTTLVDNPTDFTRRAHEFLTNSIED